MIFIIAIASDLLRNQPRRATSSTLRRKSWSIFPMVLPGSRSRRAVHRPFSTRPTILQAMAVSRGYPRTRLYNKADIAIDVAGRICQQLSTDLNCCLPCPQLDWFYPLGFYERSRNPGYVGTASLMLTILMLISWAVLPTSKTKRHYLNVALVFSVFLAEVC